MGDAPAEALACARPLVVMPEVSRSRVRSGRTKMGRRCFAALLLLTACGAPAGLRARRPARARARGSGAASARAAGRAAGGAHLPSRVDGSAHGRPGHRGAGGGGARRRPRRGERDARLRVRSGPRRRRRLEARGSGRETGGLHGQGRREPLRERRAPGVEARGRKLRDRTQDRAVHAGRRREVGAVAAPRRRCPRRRRGPRGRHVRAARAHRGRRRAGQEVQRGRGHEQHALHGRLLPVRARPVAVEAPVAAPPPARGSTRRSSSSRSGWASPTG